MTNPSRPIIAVAGSSGKTTTKEMIASILQRRWYILKSKYNRNNRHAVRAHAKQIRSNHRAVVLEYGMSARGHLRQSCRILRPDMAVITMVGSAHIGNVGGSLKTLIAAKSELIQYMNPAGTLFLNADDHNSQHLHIGGFKGTIITIGIKNHADYQAYNVRYGSGGMSFRVNFDGAQHDFFIPIYGIHNVYNALFAIAVTDLLGFGPDTIRHGLKNYTKLAGRLRVYKLRSGIRVIDDTFNANPHSVKAALDVLDNIGRGKNIAVLGDMRELGSCSVRGHQEVGRYLAGKHIDTLVTFGKRAKRIGEVAITKGFPASRVIHVKDRLTLHRRIKQHVSTGTTILVKGSNATRMAVTVSHLKNSYKNR